MRRFEINQRLGNLRIVSVQKSDAGTYKCIASNEHGMATAEAFVNVANNGEPLSKLSPATATAAPSRTPPLSTPLASRPSIKQIAADRILLNWQLIDSVTGLVIDSPQTLNSVAYFKVLLLLYYYYYLLLLLFLLSYYHYYYYYHIIIFIIIIILLLLLSLVFVEIMPDKIILDHKKSYLVIFSQF